MSHPSTLALRPLPRWLATTACTGVLIGIVMVARQAALLAPLSGRPLVLTTAATIDLVVTLPLVCWWMLGRTYRWSPVALLPLYFLGLVVAGRVLPEGERQALLVFHVLAAPLELLSVWLLVKRARKPGRLGEILRYEASVLRHALGRLPTDGVAETPSTGLEVAAAPNVAAPVTTGPTAPPVTNLTYHRKTAYGAIVFALLMATAVEVPAVHFLTSLWSEKLAWVLTALGVYGALWIVGDWRATRAHPFRVADGVLQVRFGLRWRLNVPVDQIVALRPPTHDEMTARRGVDLRLALPGASWLVLELDRRVHAEGIYGLRRMARTVGLGVDDPELLKTAVQAAGADLSAPIAADRHRDNPNPEHR